MQVCHAGHSVDFFAFGNAYCDCGLSGCALTRSPPPPLIDPRALAPPSVPPFAAYKVRCREQVDLAALQEQCRSLTARTKDTFWVGAQDTPRCAFETMALSILHQQSALHSIPVEAVAGAEWWVQYKELDLSQRTEGDRSASVDLHYDKDEALAEAFGIGVFPAISTVTYLSASALSTPTLVLLNTASTPVGDPVSQCFVSRPALLRHVAFNGQLLHGAPIELLAPSSASGVERRITFLVNVWTHHRPQSVVPVSSALIAELALSPLELGLTLEPDSAAVATIKVGRKKCAGRWVELPFVGAASAWGQGEDEAALGVRMFLPAVCEAIDGCFHIAYTHADVAARLEYAEDEDVEEELGEELMQSVFCSEVRRPA